MSKRLSPVLDRLEEAKRRYGEGWGALVEKLLRSLRGLQFDDSASLLRFHDTLLFLRAFPQSQRVARVAEALLRGIARQVERIRASGDDMSLFDSEQFSGVAGTTLRNSWTFELARVLVRRHAREISAEWSWEEQARRMAILLPNVMPLLEDDSLVEPDTPFSRLMTTAAGTSQSELQWLLRSFEALPIPALCRTDLYDALDVQLRWKLEHSKASRTVARREVDRLFCHDRPLLRRSDISLAEELASVPLPLRKLGREAGSEMLDFVRDALAVRYRELHGTTNGAAEHIHEAAPGRGTRMYIWGLTPEWRLPLRAYYAGFTVKNGVPINYFEAIGLFEWLEVGFNTYYAFREGETAWTYSKILHLLNQVSGATCFSVYPYQLGQENEEAIASGAFWFYRKLGFRPGRPDLFRITQDEEAAMRRNPKHRTSARTLRTLATGHMFYEFGSRAPGAWDTFSTGNVVLALQRHMAQKFGGDAGKMRAHTSQSLAETVGVNIHRWNELEKQAFSNFACVLSLLPEVNNWTSTQKKQLVTIIRAKAAPEETPYLRLLQQHNRLRAALLRLGSE